MLSDVMNQNWARDLGSGRVELISRFLLKCKGRFLVCFDSSFAYTWKGHADSNEISYHPSCLILE